MKRILMIQGHPDPAGGRLLHGLAQAYEQAAVAAGHEVRLVDVAHLEFPLLRTQAEFESGEVPEGLKGAIEDLRWAQHVVILFPLWLGTMPALLKAFLEQAFRPGVAFAYQEKGLPKKLMAGRSARVVVTMGMPALVYRWFFMAHGVRVLKRSILQFVGITPVRETFIGGVGEASDARRNAWLAMMRDLGGRAA